MEGFPKRDPGPGEKLCPYDGIAYNKVPGYEPGYGCPICKAIGQYHLPVPIKKGDSNSKG